MRQNLPRSGVRDEPRERHYVVANYSADKPARHADREVGNDSALDLHSAAKLTATQQLFAAAHQQAALLDSVANFRYHLSHSDGAPRTTTSNAEDGLRIAFAASWASQEVSDGPRQQRERAGLISRLFALITMKLEDAAGIAADCQGQLPLEELRESAEKLDALISEAATVLAGAAAVLTEDR